MAIRKYTKFINNTKHNIPGIIIPPSTSAFSRTICACGFYSDKQVYECPNCGNTDFKVASGYETNIENTPLKISIHGSTVKISYVKTTINLYRDVEVNDKEILVLNYNEKATPIRLERHCSLRPDEALKVLKENFDKLPPILQGALELVDYIESPSLNELEKALTPRPKLEMFLRLNYDKYPSFCAHLVRQVLQYGGRATSWMASAKKVADDIDFTTIEEYFDKYEIPEEFKDFLDKFPDRMLHETTWKRLFTFSPVPSAKFELPANWNDVPSEIKNVMKYYLENGMINITTYLRLGEIDQRLFKKKDILNKYLKKYLMQWTDQIVQRINQDFKYLLENGIPLSETTFDSKWINVHRNLSHLKKTLARSEEDIDNFINYLDVDAVGAVSRLAQSKRTKKPKSTA